MIFNPNEQPAHLRVALGSHLMSHVEQFNNNVTQDKDRVKLITIPKNHFVLFYRNLLHQGVSYLSEHCRVFAYVDLFLKNRKPPVNLAEPGHTSKYVAPEGDNDIAPFVKSVEV